MLFSVSYESEKTEFNDVLEIADEIKSSDFVKYTELLSELSNQRQMLSESQQQKLDYLLSYQLVYSGQTQDATTKLLNLIDTSNSNTIKFRAYGLLINSLVVSRNYSEVFKYFDDFHNLLGKIPDEDLKVYGLGMLAFVFNSINEFELGLYYSEKRLEVSTNARHRCIGLQYKAESLHRTKRYDDFSVLYQQAIDECSVAVQPVYTGIIRAFRLEQLVKQDPKQALEYLSKYSADVDATAYKLLSVWYQVRYLLGGGGLFGVSAGHPG